MHMSKGNLSINLKVTRPFFQYSAVRLFETIQTSLSENPPDLEISTLAYDELKHRKKAGRAEDLFKKTNLHPIPWLKEAKESLQNLDQPPYGRHQGHLYVVLIEGYTEINGWYGAYVGSSRYRPETRFKQHNEGKNASSIVKRRGHQILHSLCWPWQTVPGAKGERILWESALNRCLATKVPKVSGDFTLQKEWPMDFQRPLQRVSNLKDLAKT